jgi:hypothetical protein
LLGALTRRHVADAAARGDILAVIAAARAAARGDVLSRGPAMAFVERVADVMNERLPKTDPARTLIRDGMSRVMTI